MSVTLVNIIIPVYKSILSQSEEQSFLQCLRVLGKYPLRIVLPNGLDTSYYENHLRANKIVDFKFDYF
ncbi:MAG: hypothetical protein PHF61_06380, partial [Bacteroidales bacterium]|nr:hypothetical protein [Bacteroidales bacterium]